MTAVDVVVAGAADAGALRRCLARLVANGSGIARRVLVVPDSEAGVDVIDCAREFERRGEVSVLPRPSSRGFAAAVNVAIANDPMTDLVVLREHVVVHGDGIGRLLAHANCAPHVGIVVPFTNAAGVADYPPLAPRDVADVPSATLAADATFASANAGAAVSLPFVESPCFCVTRACLDKVGLFDTSNFAIADAPEADFSVRAAYAGFIAMLAGDVFVGNEACALDDPAARDAAPHRSTLRQRYPDFVQREALMRARHPGRALARRVDVARLAGLSRPLVVFISHAWGGGVRRHMHDLARLATPRAEVLFLEPAAPGVVRLHWPAMGEAFEVFFDLPAELGALTRLLRALPVARLHFHHVHGLPEAILELPALADLPYDCTLHDYFPICPRYHLIDEHGRYCGEGDPGACTRCTPGQWGIDVIQWRQRFDRLLRGAQRVIAPSRDVAQRVERRIQGLAILVWPHPEAPIHARAPAVRVATIGLLSPAKGLRVVVDCARDAAASPLPLAFRILGGTTEPIGGDVPSIGVLGEYDDADLPAILAAERPDVLWFPTQVPETYSYTLSAAMATGLPIVASAIGALPERLAGHPDATLVRWDAAPDEWNRALLAAAPSSLQPAPEPLATGTAPAAYAERYLAPVAWQSRPADLAVACAEAASRAFAPDAPPGRELTLPELYRAGVECGIREARQELTRRIGRFSGDVEQFERFRHELEGQHAEIVAERDRAVQELARTQAVHQAYRQSSEDDLARARARIDELESSTSWRLTAPLRHAVHATRVAIARARAGVAGIRQLPRRAQVAATVLRHDGPRALAARVATKLRGGQRYRPAEPLSYAIETSMAPLAFVPAERPRVSIVIPVFGQPLLTYTCLKGLQKETPAGEYEVIVVDDASPEPAADALAPVVGIRIERNARNLGFIGSCNRGAALARGELIVLLNNDTIVTPGWLGALESTFRDHPDAGLVGAKLVYPDGTLQEAGGIVWRDGSAWNVGRGDDPARPEYNYVREADYCSGACLAIPASLFRELGGFDPRYAPAYYEDTDLAFAVRAAGRKVYYQPAATIVHFEGRTSGTDTGSGIKRHQVANQATFREKWASVLASHRPNGVAPDLERDRAVSRRVLVIEACMLTPDQDSGSMRMLAIVELLIELGCKVTFVADNLEHREPYVGDLQRRGVEVLFAPYVRSVSDVIATRGREFDLAIVARHYIAVKHLDALRRFAPQALVAFDTVDLHFLRTERQAELDGGALTRSAARARRDEELSLIRKSDVTIVVSPVEQQVLAGLAPEARVLLLTNVHEPQPGGRPLAERRDVVFIGGFQHPPNTDAVMWYASEVLPHLRRSLPGVATYIVGSKVPPSVRALAGPDFVVTGYVPDVAPYFTGCRVSIAPLRYGAGVKGKVNLAMSYGLPVVATSAAVEGMHLTPGEDVLVADDAAHFAEAVARLFRDDALWHRLSEGGVANIRRHFSRSVAREALERLLAMADSRKAAAGRA